MENGIENRTKPPAFLPAVKDLFSTLNDPWMS
jgi:hypothetical protein